jgi:hypothetical protein
LTSPRAVRASTDPDHPPRCDAILTSNGVVAHVLATPGLCVPRHRALLSRHSAEAGGCNCRGGAPAV